MPVELPVERESGLLISDWHRYPKKVGCHRTLSDRRERNCKLPSDHVLCAFHFDGVSLILSSLVLGAASDACRPLSGGELVDITAGLLPLVANARRVDDHSLRNGIGRRGWQKGYSAESSETRKRNRK